MKSACELKDIAEVTEYWKKCLELLEAGRPDTDVASLMVNVVSNDKDDDWSTSTESHPAYSLIFELAASLELPPEMTGNRAERWHCIRVLLNVMEDEHTR